jgi:hypothetical protein
VVRVAVQVLAGPTVWWGRRTGGHADQFGEGHHALTLSRSLLSAKLAGSALYAVAEPMRGAGQVPGRLGGLTGSHPRIYRRARRVPAKGAAVAR